MSRRSTRMGNVRWVRKTYFSMRRKKRKMQRIARRRNRGK